MLVKSRIKYIQSLGQKKFRDQSGCFIAEGPKIVQELLEAGLVKEVYGLQEWIMENSQLLTGIESHEITEQELEKISQVKTPNKVLALLNQFSAQEPEVTNKLILALCGIQDPGNLGTIIRIADWFGVEQVVCSEDTVDVYNPKVVQSTMGSIARVKVLYKNLEDWLDSLTETTVYATVLEGADIRTIKKPVKGIILVGNESQGIPESLLAKANMRITIPRKGGAESLNAGVATGIVLSHLT
ncbi:MAG: RNA methyltransferase [Chitinophagales bacterium]|nr:RNA methyltransferase [Chitinophagales bacterium]